MKHSIYRIPLRCASVALLLLAAACSDGVTGDDLTSPDANNPAANPGDAPLVTVRFASDDPAASDGDAPATRTTIGDDGRTVLWKTADNISISAVKDGTTEVDNKLYHPTTAAASSAFAPYSGGEMSLTAGTYNFLSYYPRQSVTEGKVSFKLEDMKQTSGTSSDHIGKKDFMWAAKSAAVAGDGTLTVKLEYEHLFPMLVFTLKNAGERTVDHIVVRSADGTTPVRGTAVITLADGKITEITNGNASATLTFTTAMGADGTGRLLILPQKAGTKLFVALVTSGGAVYEYAKTAPAAGGLAGGKSYGMEFDLDATTGGDLKVYPAGTWQIGDADALRTFAQVVNRYQTQADAVLTKDIDLEGAAWEPIGNSTASYAGEFDGKGHTVSGLNVGKDAGYYAGLFGYLSGATVKNLGVVDGSVTAENSIAVGGIAGWAEEGTTITNCFFAGSVSGNQTVGGIAGQNNGGTITGCFTSGSVTATSSAGGIAGRNYGANAKITACYTGANVTAGTKNAGGIAGYNSGTLSACYATGTVEAKDFASGIAGDNTTGTLTGCLALGSSVSRAAGSSETSFGRVTGSYIGTITSCYAYDGMRVRGATLSDDNFATATNFHGQSLTPAECLSEPTYTTCGFTSGSAPAGWSFDTPDGSWTYLPWNTALYGYDKFKAAVRIKVPAHLSPQP